MQALVMMVSGCDLHGQFRKDAAAVSFKKEECGFKTNCDKLHPCTNQVISLVSMVWAPQFRLLRSTAVRARLAVRA